MTGVALLSTIAGALDALRRAGTAAVAVSARPRCACGSDAFVTADELAVAGFRALLRRCRRCRVQVGLLHVDGVELASALAAPAQSSARQALVGALEALRLQHGADVVALSSTARSCACRGRLGRPAELRVGGIAGVLRTCSDCGRRHASLFADGHDLAAELAASVAAAAPEEPATSPAADVEVSADDRTPSPPTPFADLEVPDDELDLEALAGELEPAPETVCPSCRARRRDELELERANELTPADVALAEQVLHGWRVRLAAVRVVRLLDENRPCYFEDIEQLVRAVGALPQLREARA